MILDITAEGVSIEVQEEAGYPGHFKLYIHKDGETLVRVCKLEPTHLILPAELFNLGAQIISEPEDPPIQIMAECSVHGASYPANEQCQLCIEDSIKKVGDLQQEILKEMNDYARITNNPPSDFERGEMR
jgi:hypothetical protein